MSTQRSVAVRRRWRALLVFPALLGAMAVTSPAAAHLGLSTTDPANGARLAHAPQRITLTFTKAADPVGPGFRLATADGRRVTTSATSPDGGRTWLVGPARPLTSDRYRLTWKVVASDAHARSGAVSFEVLPAVDAAPPARGSDAVAPVAASSQQGSPQASPPSVGRNHDTTSGSGTSADTSPDASSGTSGGLGLLAGMARWLSIVGVMVSVGALIVSMTTLVGSPGDVLLATRLVRMAALTAAVGAMGECLIQLLTLGAATPAAAAAAPLARLAGSAALAVSATMASRRTGGRRTQDVRALPPEPLSARRGGLQLLLAPPVQTERVRAVLDRPMPAILASVTAIGSFLLDGHTASVGPRWAMLPADAAHALGASVWAGGVVLLAALLLVRARAGVPTGAGELAVRFSVPASAAAAAVAVAGGIMLLLIVEQPAELLSTPWGRVMATKLVLVGGVALLGYANNRYALPALDAWQPHTARMLRRTVAVEGAVMMVVLLVTAALVASGM